MLCKFLKVFKRLLKMAKPFWFFLMFCFRFSIFVLSFQLQVAKGARCMYRQPYDDASLNCTEKNFCHVENCAIRDQLFIIVPLVLHMSENDIAIASIAIYFLCSLPPPPPLTPFLVSTQFWFVF